MVNKTEILTEAMSVMESIRLMHPDIQWIGGFGSFWNSNPDPGDIDLIIGVSHSHELPGTFRSDLALAIGKDMSMIGVHTPVDLQVVDMDVDFDREHSDAGFLQSILAAWTIAGHAPKWKNEQSKR